ncbi:glycosyltransferase family 4 protein [Chroococcus sp. FPU101]|uniref:glycosyltransferase family 4 protein n=1 Tax=Chroococcus sp. FPU101 TaxID=1974212 RepID=UPI001A8E27E3|nr:glycosyltransferase family 4 protein [Chroococcus sp. FPU101]GFE68204.1 glycosyl transferase, group 1 [Chroococcus sp. FPU101]
MIYQCIPSSLNVDGGVKNYVKSLLDWRIPNTSDNILTTLQNIRLEQFDLLHIHGAELLGEIWHKCPVIYTLHNHNSYCPSGTKYLTANQLSCERTMSKLGCTWGHLVEGCGSRRPQNMIKNLQRSQWELETLKRLKILIIANSNYVRGWLIKNGLPPHQVITLHCGVSKPSAIQPLTQNIHQNQRILFVGRIVPDKGLSWLLEALTLTEPKIHLDIAGDGWERPQMENLVKKLGLTKRVTWQGWCHQQKLDELYQQCFCVIFPSVWPEPAGLVTLEAYARYRPVIASAVGGIPEYLHSGETGLLIKANHRTQLAAAINELSQDYFKTQKMGQQGHTLFKEKFTMDIHVQKLQKIYEQYLA